MCRSSSTGPEHGNYPYVDRRPRLVSNYHLTWLHMSQRCLLKVVQRFSHRHFLPCTDFLCISQHSYIYTVRADLTCKEPPRSASSCLSAGEGNTPVLAISSHSKRLVLRRHYHNRAGMSKCSSRKQLSTSHLPHFTNI